MSLRSSLVEDALHLFYPHTCNGCGSDLLFKDQLLCAFCIKKLPRTYYAKYPGNIVEKIFQGRLNIRAAHSEFYFSKGKLIQHLIHQLKYKGNREIGIYLGNMIGETLLQSNRFPNIDAVVPLPMFADKEFKRGYNQATIISNGIAETIQASVLNGIVTRSRLTETQTNKHRAERWRNVEGSFHITSNAAIKGKNILLVDDVITTGASIEACGSIILQVPGSTLNIATLAYASK